MAVVYENIYRGKYPRLILKAAPEIDIISYTIHVSGGRVRPEFVSIDIKYSYEDKIYQANIKRDEFKDLNKIKDKLYRV